MRYILFIIVIIFGHSSAQAQVPGYQGKRFFIEMGGSFFFNLGYPTAQNKGPQSFPFNEHTGHFTLKDRYSLAVHYVFSRKNTIKLAYNYQVSGLTSSAITPNLFIPQNDDYHTLFYQLHLHDFNLGFNLYGKSDANLAPLGFYWDMGIRFVFANGVLRDQRVQYADNRPDNRPIDGQVAVLAPEPSTVMFGITAMWGYRTIIANRLTFTFGIETTLFPQYAIANPPPSVPFPLAGNNQLSEYQKKTIQNVQDRYILGLHIGIGALIF